MTRRVKTAIAVVLAMAAYLAFWPVPIAPVASRRRRPPAPGPAPTRACQAAGGPRHFSAAGCEIPDHTPEANMRAHAATLREIGG